MAKNGLMNKGLFDFREFLYDNMKFRRALDLAAQSAYFLGIVLTQIGNLLGNKTARETIFKKSFFQNPSMIFSIVFAIGLACFLLYVPSLNRALNLAPNRFLWWLPSVPFVLYLVAFNEVRKYFIRKYPGRFPSRQLTY